MGRDPLLTLVRLEVGPEGTFGVLLIDARVFCVTLEPTWRFNEPNRSAVPPGQYLCKLISSFKFGNTYHVQDVSGRTEIIFHPGNFPHDTQGCIILAEHYGKLRDERVILNSGQTFKAFMDAMKGHGQTLLTIRHAF